MRPSLVFLTSSALCLGATVPFALQEGRDAEHDAMHAEKAQAFLRLETGPTAIVHDATGAPLGSILDYEIETKSGRLQSIVVHPAQDGTEGTGRLVPFDRFDWSAERGELVLPMIAADLRSLPKYLPDREHERSQPAEAGASRGGAPAEASMKEKPVRLTSHQVLGTEVHAAEGVFGKSSGLVLEARQGRIAFVLVGSATPREGSPLLVPWKALDWRAGREEGEPGHFSIAMSSDRLTDAPRLEGDDLHELADPATVAAIQRFYRIPVPAGS